MGIAEDVVEKVADILFNERKDAIVVFFRGDEPSVVDVKATRKIMFYVRRFGAALRLTPPALDGVLSEMGFISGLYTIIEDFVNASYTSLEGMVEYVRRLGELYFKDCVAGLMRFYYSDDVKVAEMKMEPCSRGCIKVDTVDERKVVNLVRFIKENLRSTDVLVRTLGCHSDPELVMNPGKPPGISFEIRKSSFSKLHVGVVEVSLTKADVDDDFLLDLLLLRFLNSCGKQSCGVDDALLRAAPIVEDIFRKAYGFEKVREVRIVDWYARVGFSAVF